MGPSARAKFKCTGHTSLGAPHQGGAVVLLQPVYSTDPAHPNHAFWKATPAGEVHMTITNPAAAALFELGATYTLEFTRDA
jgi:hypothetical protein